MKSEDEFCKRILSDALWEEEKESVTASRTRKQGRLRDENERSLIMEWREKRLKNPFRRFADFFTLWFGVDTVKSFFTNLNVMVFIHIAVSITAVYLCKM